LSLFSLGAEKVFRGAYVKRDLRSYRRKGPRDTTRMLLDGVKAEGVADATILDIGGGVGVIQNELLEAGASRATGAEAATEFIAAAEEEARRQGHFDRVTLHQGDFVEIADEVAPADIVTLDRVICCYPNMESLVGLSVAKAHRVYAVVYPRDSRLNGIGHRILNALFWLRRNPFRVYIHATRDVEALIHAAGFRRTYFGKTINWQVAVYARNGKSVPDSRRVDK
jgi:magnesium-protoporphyrin O-methyltransferase